MQDQIFRVRVSQGSGLRMRSRPETGAEIIVRLSNRQAVVRLDENDYGDWWLVFADTPGDGLYVGYISSRYLIPIEAEVAEMVELEIEAPPESETEIEESVAPAQPGLASTHAVPTGDPRTIQLSPHFSFYELIKSDTATRLGLNNMPSLEEYQNLVETAEHMEAVRRLLGSKAITVSSGYRGDALNQAIGGSATSAHRLGYAVDFVCLDFGSPYEICREIVESPIMENVDQLIQEKNRWVHISFDPRRRGQVLSYVLRNGAFEYVHELIETDQTAMV